MADLFASLLPVRLNDGVADANNAKITNAAPSSSDYGLTVRQVGIAAAAALADATANPTTTLSGVDVEVYNGTTWDRMRSVVNGQDSTGTGIAAAGILGQLDDTATGAVTENQFAPVRISTRRALLIEGVASGTNINVNLAASAATVTVDSELPAAAALADNTANPTVPGVGAFNMVFDGSTWDRQPGNSASGVFVQGDVAHDAPVTANPLLAGARASAAAPTDVSADGDAVRLWALRSGALATVLTAAGALIGGDATNGLDVDVTRVTGTVTVDSELPAAGALADNTANPTTTTVGSFPHGFDGTTWDRLRTTDASDGNAALTTTGVLDVGVGPGFARRFNPSNLGTANNSASSVDVNGAATAVVQVNTSTTGTYILEVTDDGTTWKSGVAYNYGSALWVTGSNLTPTVGDLFVIAVQGMRQFRLRTVSTLGATMAHVITLSLGDAISFTRTVITDDLGKIATIRDLAANDALNVAIVDGSGNQITTFGGGTQYVGDAAATSTPTGTIAMGLANAAAPTDVSANNDAVAAWMLRNGSLVVNLASGGTLQAAATLADATANPSLIAFASNLMGYNGTTWDRVRTANTGRLQVDVITGGGSPAASELPSSYNMIDVYGSTSATAAGGNADVASNTPANTKLTYIRQISAAASGATKVQLLFGATIKWVGFLTAAVPTGIWRFDPPIPVTGDGSTAVKVNVTNREASAMDLYARINAIVQA